jgi:hypothetical protein
MPNGSFVFILGSLKNRSCTVHLRAPSNFTFKWCCLRHRPSNNVSKYTIALIDLIISFVYLLRRTEGTERSGGGGGTDNGGTTHERAR